MKGGIAHAARWLTLASTFAAALGHATAAFAQVPVEQPESPPAAPQPDSSEAPAAPQTATAPASAAADAAAAAARLDDIEQLVRIAARKHELLEEEAATRKKEAPLVSVDDRGFALRLPNNSFVLRLRGLLQADARFFAKDDTLEANDTFLVRRFRPSLEGTLFSLVDFRFVPEFAGTVQVLDGYIDLHPRPWFRVRVGKFKVPIGLERLQSDADLPIVERALDQNLSSQRDVGVLVWGEAAGGIVNYVAGVINGAADNASTDTDIDHAKDFVGRIFIEPFRLQALRDFGNLGIGFGAQSGNRKGRLPTAVSGLVIPLTTAQTGLSPLRTAGQNTFFSYLQPTTDTTGALTTFTHERATRINPQLYYYYENVGLLAEYLYLWQGVQRGNSTAVLKHQAAHASLTYTLGGREGYDGVTPLVAFDPAANAWGALQIAAQWSWFRADPLTFGDPSVPGSTPYADPLKSAQRAQAFAGGLAWVPRRTLRVALDYEQTRFKGGGGVAAIPATPGVPAMAAVLGDRKTEYVFIGRVQVNF